MIVCMCMISRANILRSFQDTDQRCNFYLILGKIMGKYPTTFADSGSTNIGRGRLLPTTSWDALWYDYCELIITSCDATYDLCITDHLPAFLITRYGISQWFGITEQDDIDYVLPNSQNFGCELFTGELYSPSRLIQIWCYRKS